MKRAILSILVPALGLTLLLSGCAGMTPEELEAARAAKAAELRQQGWQRLSSQELRQRFSDATAVDVNGKWMTYLAPDGSLRFAMTDGSFTDTGQGEIRDNGVRCYRYRKLFDGKEQCGTYWTNGEEYVMLDLSSAELTEPRYTLKPGNPENL